MLQKDANIPNIVVLCMTYNDESVKNSEKAIKETWAKRLMNDIIPNIKFFFYTSGKRNTLNEKTHKITVTSGDDAYSTFEKTVKAIELLNKKHIEYDYIVRVNLSTYINITFLNNYIYMINQTIYKNYIHCSSLVHVNDTYFPCGKILIFNKEQINTILSYKGDLNEADDVIYGNIFKVTNNHEAFTLYKSISIPIYYNWTDNFYYSCSEYSIDVLKKYIYVSVRDINNNRENEVKSMYKIHDVMSDYKTNYNDFIEILSNHTLVINDNAEEFLILTNKTE